MIIVDVGANKGDLALDICPKKSDIIFYGIEPNYILFEKPLKALEKAFQGVFNYVPFALADFSGTSKLYASQHMAGQIGSLLKINESNSWPSDISSSFSDKKISESIDVNVIKVSEFLHDYRIVGIDFLKIDAQGMDLLILSEFLMHADVKVVAVEVEIMPFGLNSHYKNSRNSFLDLLELMQRFKYEIIRIMPANSDCNEYNVFLAKSYDDYRNVDLILEFKNLAIFSRFWKVLGVGNDSQVDVGKLQSQLVRKFISSFFHPISSYKSLLIKLTS
jgi:FkbM family methyltransferase